MAKPYRYVGIALMPRTFPATRNVAMGYEGSEALCRPIAQIEVQGVGSVVENGNHAIASQYT